MIIQGMSEIEGDMFLLENDTASELVKELQRAIEESNDHQYTFPIAIWLDPKDGIEKKEIKLLIKPSRNS